MKINEMIKWLIEALTNEVNKNPVSYQAWREAGALEALMIINGKLDRTKPLIYKTKSKHWLFGEIKERYPEVILRMANEMAVKLLK